MFRLVSSVFLVTTLLSLKHAAGQSEKNLAVDWGLNGPKSLRYMGLEYLSRGNFIVNSATFSDPQQTQLTHNEQPQSDWNSAQFHETLTFAWGSVQIAYSAQKTSLNLSVDIQNKTSFILNSLSADALALKLPNPPNEYNGKQPMLATNIGEPSLLPLSCAKSTVLLVNEQINKPLLLGMPWSLDGGTKTVFPVRINTGREPMYPNSLPYINRPIAAGGSDHYDISLRFAPPGTGMMQMASDTIRRFAQLNPFELHWADRRPIAILVLATAATQWKTNPRGWLLDPKIDITTEAGRVEFQKRLLAWADHSISILRKMNAQGMVTWDIEGEQFPHPITYVGDPTVFEKTAPEMLPIADEYFQRFRNAGFSVGVTIRPQRFEFSGKTGLQNSTVDPFVELSKKIEYARKRWGAKLFYIDSNGDAVNPLSADVIYRLAKQYPEVLLIPEHKDVSYYARCAPYVELRSSLSSIPSLVRLIYPHAFNVINVADALTMKNMDTMIDPVSHGDILLFRGWFDDPANAAVKAVYAKSGSKAH